MISHIVAVSKNNVIGTQNQLPWDIPEDMKFFRETTRGKILIMGRKTFESVGHPLPQRLNIVVTRDSSAQFEGSLTATSLAAALEMAHGFTDKYGDEIFIIGGGEIFRQSMNIVDRIYLTRIHKDFQGDIFYPDVDPNVFELKQQRDRTEPVPFSFLTFERRTI